jgi:hypothetical protein
MSRKARPALPAYEEQPDDWQPEEQWPEISEPQRRVRLSPALGAVLLVGVATVCALLGFPWWAWPLVAFGVMVVIPTAIWMVLPRRNPPR